MNPDSEDASLIKCTGESKSDSLLNTEEKENLKPACFVKNSNEKSVSLSTEVSASENDTAENEAKTCNSLEDISDCKSDSLSILSENKSTEISDKLTGDQNSNISDISDKKKAPLKRKVFMKKNSKVSNERGSSANISCKQIVSNEDKGIKSSSKVGNLAAKSTDRVVLKTLPKDSENISSKKDTDNNSTVVKSINIVPKKLPTKSLTEKNMNTGVIRPTSQKAVSVVRKISPKTDNNAEEKKVFKSVPKTSAIKRNISYVSTLSSKNQQEKAANEEKKPPRKISHAMKLPQKSGSMSSLHKISAAHRWSDKASSVEQIPEIIKSNPDGNYFYQYFNVIIIFLYYYEI